MKKLDRDIIRGIESTGAKVIGRRVHKGHIKFRIRTPAGTEHTIVTSGSPSSTEFTVAWAIRDTKRFL